jgi:hypothetical protein
MTPTLGSGDLLVVRYALEISPGRLVLAHLPDGTLAVKRAAERRTTAVGAPGWWLLSDNPVAGVDSRHRGPVPDDRVIAVVVARIWPRPRLLRRWVRSR